MREVKMPEITVMHCDWCGCKNKIKTVYGHKGEPPVGFTLRCCNCGHMDIFNRNWSKPMDLYTHKYDVISMECVRDQKCTHHECPLYTTNRPNNKKPVKPACCKKYKRKLPDGVMLNPKSFI